jgi:hypothetical protein
MNTKIKRILFMSAALAMLFATGFALDPLQRMRAKYDLSNEPVKGVSPQLALATQVLGWGRGLIIDVLWIRMEALKEHEKFFELVQLADWACKLAPRFPQVWDIQSWNLAYNVSCKVTHLPDRWAWVEAAIELLRDQGIPQNPHSAMLYDRLAWIYFHKIGEQDDNAHQFYKQRFGLMMHEVLGGEGDEETLKALISAPRTLEQLLEDEQTRRFVAECRAHQFEIADRFFDLYRDLPSVPAAVKEIAKRPQNAEPMRKIAVYARAKRLREEYKLDPERMLALRKKYGPFDWRSAYPHAIYWATVGLEKLDELEKRTLNTLTEFGVPIPEQGDPQNNPIAKDEKLYEFRRITLERIIYASMQSLTRHGRLLFDTNGSFLLEAGTDYRFADATLPLYEKIIEAHGQRFQMSTRDAYMNFLRAGMFEFALVEQEPRAKAYDYFRRLKEKFPEEVGNLSFDEYLDQKLFWFSEDMTTQQVRTIVYATILKAFLALACNADDKAAIYEAQAKGRCDRWNAKAIQNLRGTVRYRQLKEAALTNILTGKAGFPPPALENLKQRLNESKDDLVQTVLANLRKAQEKPPTPEEVEDKWQKETLR